MKNKLIINMSNNNKTLNLADVLLEKMKSESESADGRISHKNCPLGLTEEFVNLPLIVAEIRAEQKSGFTEIKTSIDKISDTILDTDKGMAARVKSLEGTKNSFSKWIWIVLASGTTILITKYIASLF